MKMKCPTCQKEIEYSIKNPNRPFCSLACKGDDLVAWADEKYSVPSEIKPEDGEEVEALLQESGYKIH
jgi:endogenous inhibitor of DNA gyrase (YacG/DUF329 family)